MKLYKNKYFLAVYFSIMSLQNLFFWMFLGSYIGIRFFKNEGYAMALAILGFLFGLALVVFSNFVIYRIIRRTP